MGREEGERDRGREGKEGREKGRRVKPYEAAAGRRRGGGGAVLASGEAGGRGRGRCGELGAG